MDKKKVFLIICTILALGILLRLINLNKPEGMWNDEYLTWEIAKAAFPYEFFQAIMKNCHAPLHYIYLKIWMYFFSDSDYSLRMSSLVPGVLSIVVMYFAGRKLGKKASDTAGITAAAFCAISAFLIYFSQEVRIYSLLFLLSAINVICAINTMENPDKKNCCFFALASLLVMLEHTIGFVFVFFSVCGVIFFADKNKKFRKYIASALLIALIVFIPVAIFLYNVMFNQQYFSQWWAPFSLAKTGFFFTDLFSPYLINITNAPPYFWSMVYDGSNVNFGFIIFALTPLLIASLCMLKGIFAPDKNVKYFLLVSLGVYLTVLAASLFGKIIFLTKYMTEIYPPLILLCVHGFASFKDKSLKVVLATVYAVICLFFIAASKYSPVKLIRTEGQNIPVAMLSVLEKKDTDKLVFLYYPKERFSKYMPEVSYDPKISSISKYDFFFIKDKALSATDAFLNGKEDYKSVFFSKNNPPLDMFLSENVFSDIKKGDKFFLVDFAPVSLFSVEHFSEIIHSEKKYNETPFLYLAFSYIRNYIVDEAGLKLAFDGVIRNYDWRIYIFEKT